MTNFDPDDELARMLAQADQASAAQRPLAGLLANFQKELTQCGFERAEALELVRDYFGRMLGSTFDPEGA